MSKPFDVGASVVGVMHFGAIPKWRVRTVERKNALATAAAIGSLPATRPYMRHVYD
jgi:hypothetical protein